MKAIRKTVGLLMVLMLAISLATTTFAADSGSITVENPKAGETYTAYLVFDVVYNEAKSAFSYTIAANSQWLEVVQAYAGVTLSDAVTDGPHPIPGRFPSWLRDSCRSGQRLPLKHGIRLLQSACRLPLRALRTLLQQSRSFPRRQLLHRWIGLLPEVFARQ